jgi:tetratricopeptide (TPR) repeat protein
MVGISLDQDRSALQRVVKEKGFAWPQYFDGKGWDNPFWKQYGANGIPFTLLVGPDGSLLWKGHPGAGLKKEIDKAFKEHPPQLVDPKAVAKAKELLDEAETKSKSGDAVAALKLLARFPDEARGDEDTKARLEKVSKSVEAGADRMLAEVNPLIEKGDYGAAAARLKDLVRALSGTSVAAKARRQLNDLMGRPEVRQKIEWTEKTAKADEALAVATDLQKQKKDDLAYARFKSVAKDFPDTPAAALAAAQVRRYEADPAFVKRVVDKEVGTKARAALSMARSYRTARKTDQARQKYQSVIDDFPNTTYADAARQELTALGK